MSERDRALFAERLRFNGLPKKAAMIEKANGYFLDEVSALEAIAAARAEGDQPGYERGIRATVKAVCEATANGYEIGRREAIEECATALPVYYKFSDYADLQAMAQNAVATYRGYIRALAEPTTQQEDGNGESARPPQRRATLPFSW